MKYNRRVQLYLSEENSNGRYFKLNNGKSLYLKSFKGQTYSSFNESKAPSLDLKSAFKDLLSQAYELGAEDGKRTEREKLKNNLSFVRELLK